MRLKFFSVAFPIATMTFLAAIGTALWFVAVSFSEVAPQADDIAAMAIRLLES